MPKNIVIRPLGRSDMRQYDAFPEKGRFSHQEQIDRQSDDGYGLFGLFQDESLAAVCHIRRHGPFDSIVRQSYSHPEIGNLFVLPAYRNQGLAGQMITGIESILVSEGYRSVGLMVSSQNQAAIHLYEKLGYRPTQNFPPRPDKSEPERIYYLKQLA